MPVAYNQYKSICAKCGQAKCNSEFRTGNTMNRYFSDICTECRSEEIAVVREDIINEEQTTAVKTLVAAIRGNKIDAPHVTELCDEMMNRFGGLREFTMGWKQQIDNAIIAKPGSKTVLDAFRQIKDLVVQSTEHRGSAPDVADLGDVDLHREMDRLAERILTQTPRRLETTDA